MLTAYPNRTSPVLRGAWILETILGAKRPVPPPLRAHAPRQQARRAAEDAARAPREAPREPERVHHAVACEARRILTVLFEARAQRLRRLAALVVLQRRHERAGGTGRFAPKIVSSRRAARATYGSDSP